MTIETKTDADWFNILTTTNLTYPVWCVFGETEDDLTQETLSEIENLSQNFPEIKFYYFNLSSCPGIKKVCSVSRIVTNICYIYGMEIQRFTSDNLNLLSYFTTKANFLSYNFYKNRMLKELNLSGFPVTVFPGETNLILES